MKNYKYPKSKVSLIYIFFKYDKVKVSLNEFLKYQSIMFYSLEMTLK